MALQSVRQNPLDRQIYALTEVQARREHIGLWQEGQPCSALGVAQTGSTGS